MSTLRHLPIVELKERYGLADFVETGTFEGDGIRAALVAGFKRCFTCDLVTEFATQAAMTFSHRPDVSVTHADSVTFLLNLPADLQPCLYWLDAHQPAMYGAEQTKDNKFPIMHELSIIKTLPCAKQSVILIDDLIVIQGSPRWHQNEVCEELQIKDIDWNTLFHFLDETHEAKYLPDMEGVLQFTPKEVLN